MRLYKGRLSQMSKPDNITVFQNTEYLCNNNPTLMAESDWYDVDVITCAAPNLRRQYFNKYISEDENASEIIHNDDLLLLHEKRLQRILDVAVMNRDETVILGAFGCGALKNDPEIVALAAKNVIKDRNLEQSRLYAMIYP